MPRPRNFDTAAVVEAAKDAFWRNGYRRTGIAELEQCTGLSRSSLYRAFGKKSELFAAAVDTYIAGSLDPLIRPMENGVPSIGAVDDFFMRMRAIFRNDPRWAERGCLVMNAIAEMPDAIDAVSPVAAGLPRRLARAFGRCLAKPRTRSTATVRRRAEFLATTTVGVWITARSDRHRAARVCDAVRAEVRAWP